MGTNFYMMTRNRDLAHKNFAEDTEYGVIDETYEIVDNPYLGYRIHLNKLSFGWRPLFQKHKAFQSWRELENFALSHSDEVEFYDEYGRQYEFGDYKERVFEHAARKPEPVKWVYDYDRLFHNSTQKHLLTVRCDPEEADLWIPFNHVEYFKTEEAAKNKFHVYDYPIFHDIKYWNDPDHPFDWTEGYFA